MGWIAFGCRMSSEVVYGIWLISSPFLIALDRHPSEMKGKVEYTFEREEELI
jgi:hypothetical protein